MRALSSPFLLLPSEDEAHLYSAGFGCTVFGIPKIKILERYSFKWWIEFNFFALAPSGICESVQSL
ncbi:MAG: hypothetical protein WCY67_09490 [Acidithiobacillus sp.]